MSGRTSTKILAAVLMLTFASPAWAKVAKIHLIFTNDIHGYVDPREATFINPNFPPPIGGGASAARYIRKIRAEVADDPDAGVVLVDAGDTWQGSPVGTITEGAVMEAYFDALEYDAVVPGNHEFDRGKDVPIRMAEQMFQKFVCSNIYNVETGELVDWIVPYRIVERAGLRIGIVGAATPSTVQMAFSDSIEGLEFREILPNVERVRDELYDEHGVDVVFLVVHEGLPYDAEEGWADLQARVDTGEDIREDVRGAMDLAHVLERIPVVVAGHTHRGYDRPWIDPVTHTMVFESYGNGSSVGHVILKIDQDTGTVLGFETPRREGVLVTLWEDEWWPEADMESVLKPYLDEAEAGLGEVMGRSRVTLTRSGKSNSVMGNFVTDAMRLAFEADLGFSNVGGLRTDLPSGNVTEGDLVRLLPFGNTLVVVELDGRQICSIFDRKASKSSSGIFFSGAEVVVDPSAPEGQRVLELQVAGAPILPDRLYRCVTSDYLMEGNSGYELLTEVPDERVQYTQILTRDAVRRYLQQNSPIAPRVDDRFREDRDGPMAEYLRAFQPQ